jgi:hypothetical protein
MKNVLAENMLRFGVKNLSESDITKIEGSVLTESFSGEFEQAFPDYKAAAAAFAKAHAAGGGMVKFTGKYHHYYSIRYNPNSSDFNTYQVGILGLGIRKFKDGMFVDFAGTDEPVFANWDPSKGLYSNTSWPDRLLQNRQFILPDIMTLVLDDIKNLNKRFSVLPIADIQKMLPQYPRIQENLTKLKANTVWPSKNQFYTSLSGNAKQVYESAAAAPAPGAPAVKPTTAKAPVKPQ